MLGQHHRHPHNCVIFDHNSTTTASTTTTTTTTTTTAAAAATTTTKLKSGNTLLHMACFGDHSSHCFAAMELLHRKMCWFGACDWTWMKFSRSPSAARKGMVNHVGYVGQPFHCDKISKRFLCRLRQWWAMSHASWLSNGWHQASWCLSQCLPSGAIATCRRDPSARHLPALSFSSANLCCRSFGTKRYYKKVAMQLELQIRDTKSQESFLFVWL